MSTLHAIMQCIICIACLGFLRKLQYWLQTNEATAINTEAEMKDLGDDMRAEAGLPLAAAKASSPADKQDGKDVELVTPSSTCCCTYAACCELTCLAKIAWCHRTHWLRIALHVVHGMPCVNPSHNTLPHKTQGCLGASR